MDRASRGSSLCFLFSNPTTIVLPSGMFISSDPCSGSACHNPEGGHDSLKHERNYFSSPLYCGARCLGTPGFLPAGESVNLADRAMSNCFESVIRNEPSEPLIQR